MFDCKSKKNIVMVVSRCKEEDFQKLGNVDGRVLNNDEKSL